MQPFDVKTALKTFKILVDTREQPTASYRRRIKSMGVPCERRKLDFGDYSAACTLPCNTEYSLEKTVCIERKMNLDELCNCFCQSRKRFTREFERARKQNAKTYLLVENATWEAVYKGDYHSKMNAHALTASLAAWQARYNCQLLFCRTETSGHLIKDVLYRELKEALTIYNQ